MASPPWLPPPSRPPISVPTFEEALLALGKRRIRLPELRDAYLRAHPEARNAPDLRRLLLEALRRLEHDEVADLPQPGRRWDTSGTPALPRTASLRDVARSRRSPEAHAWLPALAFAADERHPVRRADLQAINAFLVSARGKSLSPVPTRERSLQVFGNEKRLDLIRKGEPTLFEGRISLDDLHCYPVAPPLPCEAPESPSVGRPILVLENYHSYDSFQRWNREAALYAAVAYGGGNAFRQGAGNLDELIARTASDGAFYVGDLDPSGVDILLGVNESRRAEGRTSVQPHRGLYGWLLAHGYRRPLDKAPRDGLAPRLGEVFPAGIAGALCELWAAGLRIPQESFGLEQLGGGEAAIASPEAA